ncbi:MAG: DNA replication and repair protein RecF [Pseudomonadota bacterium]|nr:DNA replication and repair protein RecF [Pseudomonadota bacterium]
MYIESLELRQFRCFETLSLSLTTPMTMITGSNGSGKTSIIEAIYSLGKGKSFRAQKLDQLIQQDAQDFVVSVKLVDGQVAGMKKQKQQAPEFRLNREESTLATIATQLPMVEINPNVTDFFSVSPAQRRKILFYYMFHVEQEFYAVWKKANRVLVQRNALLKKQTKRTVELDYWTEQLIEAQNNIDQYIEKGFEQLKANYDQVLSAFNLNFIQPEDNLQLIYNNGYSAKNENYDAVIQIQYENDLKYGFTQSGFHRLDYRVTHNGKRIEQFFSRGQLKQMGMLFILSMAQGIFEIKGKCLLLIDEIAAELDNKAQQNLFDFISKTPFQSLVTTITPIETNELIKDQHYALFHVEQ